MFAIDSAKGASLERKLLEGEFVCFKEQPFWWSVCLFWQCGGRKENGLSSTELKYMSKQNVRKCLGRVIQESFHKSAFFSITA